MSNPRSTRPPIRAAVLTSSDRCARGVAVDASGPAVCDFIRSRLAGEIVSTQVVPDEGALIEAYLRKWSGAEHSVDLLVVTGGTGLAPRDVTPEAAMRVIDRPHPGLMELARARAGAVHPRAYLSRGVAGAARSTLILTVPGSPRGAVETLEAIADILPHAIHLLRGDTPAHPGAIVPIVLVGGKSRRFGRDKLQEPLAGGGVLVERSIRALQAVYGNRVVLVGECDQAVSRLGDGAVPDRYPDRGPAGGILTALELYGEVFVLSGDLPSIERASIEAIDRCARRELQADAVVATSPSGPEPCIGIYRSGAIAALGDAIRQPRPLSLQSVLARLMTVLVPIDQSELVNANTPQDLGKP